jgi:hypothetical protein
MLIAERLLLIACEPMTGDALWPREQPSPALIVAGAVACELITQGRLPLRNGMFRPDTQIPTSHPLLNTALNSVGNHNFDASALLRAIANRMDPIVTRILDGLYRRDILHRVSQRDWLLRRKLRYPVRSMQARNEAIDALRAAAHNSDLNGLAFLFLAEVSGLLAACLRAQDHAAAEQRILTLNHVTSQSSEPLRGLAQIRSALIS